MTLSNQDNAIVGAQPRYLITLFILLNLPLLTASVQKNTATFYGLILINMLLGVMGLLTYNNARFYKRLVDLPHSIPLLIQAAVQISVFGYVILMCPFVYPGNSVQQRIPLICYQLIFAFAFDYLFKVGRGKAYRSELYLIPMVFSLNLFLWFVGDYFIGQLLLIIAAILIKTFIVRVDENGRAVHIFNPSFIVLFLLAIILIPLFNVIFRPDILNVVMVSYYELTPGFDIFLLCVGCITLWIPNSYLIPFGAYASVMLLNALTLHFYDYVILSGTVRAATFLAIFLGLTDPATSPHTKIGKFLFGVVYGLSLLLTALFFYTVGFPWYLTFFKLIPIPFLNMYSGKFDLLFKTKYSLKFMEDYYLSRIVSISIFVIVFCVTYRELESSLVGYGFLQVMAHVIRAKLGVTWGDELLDPRFLPSLP